MATASLFAIKAPETPIQYRQPDGSVVTIVKHGDEFHHWTTMNGVVVKMSPDGYWRPVANQSAYKQASAVSIAKRREASERIEAARSSAINQGEKHFLVILIEFSDLSFTVENANQAFSNLLNQNNYSANGGTGSVKDYYEENSTDLFKPTYDVYGPVKVSKSYAYYGKNDSNGYDEHPEEALYEACVALDDQINFAIYDHDNDHYVDNIFFYYAGHNEAENASENTIWPHASSVPYSYNAVFDGVRVSSYACTSEYSGNAGNNMCGIGTFCHEFGHVLGLPDFYDVNYGTNGQADHMDKFSLMAGGNYNNYGRTPPYLNSLERNMLNWMSGYSTFQTGEYNEAVTNTIDAVKNNIGFRVNADVDKEYFIFETRDGSGWDAYVAKGMLVYHVDQSSNKVYGNLTAGSLWSINDINRYSNHPCCVPVPSSNKSYMDRTVFPGAANVTNLTLTAWSGEDMTIVFSDIAFADSKITLKATQLNDSSLAKMGFNSIADPKGGQYKAGDSFAFNLDTAKENKPAKVEWYWDGAKQSGTSVTVTAGKHTVMAKLFYSSADTEEITLEITAN